MNYSFRIKIQEVVSNKVLKLVYCIQIKNGKWKNLVFEDRKMMFYRLEDAEIWLDKLNGFSLVREEEGGL